MFIRTVFLAVCMMFLPVMANANVNQQALPSVSVLASAQEIVESMLDRGNGSDYVVECLTRFPVNILLPAGFIEMQPQLVGKIRYGVPMQVRVAIKVNGMNQMNLITLWKVKKIAEVVVAARDLPARTIVSNEDLIFERREVVNFDDTVFDIESVVGLETRRPITVRTILTKAMFARPQLIRTGDNVTLLSMSGSVTVKVNGQALQGGAAGDVIRVRNISSGKGLLGKIVDANTVVITGVTR